MKLEVKYLFPTSSSGANSYIHQLPEGLGMRKILAHVIRLRKNPQTREDIFWIFTDFHGVMRVQSPTFNPPAPPPTPTEISSMASLTRKLSLVSITQSLKQISIILPPSIRSKFKLC